METVIHRLHNVIIYIDYLLLHSATHEEHLEQLDALLSLLRQHGIKINLPKCKFSCLSESGILPRVDKLQEVQNTAPPTTV
jgi:hypothetical protein